jgi:phage protein D
MSTYSDNAFGKILKNWAAEHNPPANGRAQLLSHAAIVQQRKHDLSFLIPLHSTNEWSQSLWTWFFAQSIHTGVQARL